MARKAKHEDHVNHEAWAIPYGDLITLLLAFFVVMYSVSSVNEGKYRVLSDSLVAAFRNPPRTLEPIQVGQLTRSQYNSMDNPIQTTTPIDVELVAPLSDQEELDPAEETPEEAAERAAQAAAEEYIQKEISGLAVELEQAVIPLIDEELVDIREGAAWLEVEIKSSLLFASASATPVPEAQAVLRRLAQILAPAPNRIHVEGFTDDLPINTLVYPSNWELSAARAASVVRLFTEYGVDPVRMAAIGFGEERPVASNDTAEGRARNRRVVLVVLASGIDSLDGVAQQELLRKDLAAPREAPRP
jgi:chemotaxis protein MotB